MRESAEVVRAGDRAVRGRADAAIVGAGPAGAACALLLARAGHRVLLLDRREFPRPKPCGDCLSAAATGVLDRLGVLPRVLAHGPARLYGWRIVAPDGSAFVGRFGHSPDDERPRTALSLARDRLDATLVTAAVRAGASLRTGIHVTDLARRTDGRVAGVTGRRRDDGDHVRFDARLVVGADGLRSVVARRLGLVRRAPRRRKISLTAHVPDVEAAGSPPYGEMHLIDGACAGLAPVTARDPRAHNLTLVVDAGRFGREVATDPVDFFRRTLARFPALRGRIDAAAAAVTAPVHLQTSGPFDWPTRAVVRDGAAVIGDASGYYDPFTGQGIYRALRTAELLAESVDPALREGAPARESAHRRRGFTSRRRRTFRSTLSSTFPSTFPSTRPPTLRRALHRYARRHGRFLRGGRRVQHAIEHITSRPGLAGPAIRALGRSPAAADAIVAVTGDLVRARRLLSPSLMLTFVVDQFRRLETP